jgi:SAM-dependent methyltransferase
MQDTKAKPWYDNDKFWEIVAPVMFTPDRIAATGKEIEQTISLLKAPPGSRFCDLCCGQGRHSLELACRGFNVTAVDRTGPYLEVARESAAAQSLNIEFVHEDIRRFCMPDSFDYVINMFTSFGYFEDPDDDRQALVNIHKSLRNNGKFLIDVLGKETLARIFCARRWEEAGDIISLAEAKVCRNWTWIENRWLFVKGTERYEFNVSHRIYSAAELLSLLTDCGFRPAQAYGDLSGSPYDNKAERLIIVAQK